MGRWLPRSGLALVAFAALLACRHPAILTHANFWAEDGALWYPQARLGGLASLADPMSGYLQTISRLVALAAQVLPLRHAPLAFAIVALLIQALPPTFLVSDRLGQAWPDRRTRWLAALIYVALPNAFEVYANLTNAQWHLAVLAFLVVVADPPRGWAGRAFDRSALLLSGLSGPFCLFLAPVAAWEAWRRPSRVGVERLLIVLVACIVQAVALAGMMAGQRSHAPLGASAGTLARILTYQLMLGGLFGAHALADVLAMPMWRSGALPAALAVAGLGILVYALRVGPVVLRQYCLFAGLVLLACLSHPMIDVTLPQWPRMLLPHAGGRYWALPVLGVFAVILSLLGAPHRSARWLGAALLVLAACNAPAEWSTWPYGDPPGFAAAAQRFAVATPGTEVVFPIRPQGWHMTLVR